MKVLIGNMFNSKMATLVNTINCVGVMGKGVALEFKNRFPEMYKEYVSLCEQNLVKPGEPYMYRDLLGSSVLLFPTKDHWRSPSKLEYIINGLDWFISHYKEWGITSIAFPPLGCGNGGLTWSVVGPIMYQKLINLPIDIEIYAPYGTNTEHLLPAYLSSKKTPENSNIVGIKANPFNNRLLMILEVIKTVNAGKHTLHVGRVIYQKICYVLTRCGISTGFRFTPQWYGPYSEEAKAAETILANANLIYEKQVPGGKMIEINVASSFSLHREDYTSTELQVIDACIDLFSRIKNTSQAEMIATVMFEYDELYALHNTVTEEDIYNGVMKWKKWWTDKRDEEVKETIRDLAMLGWIKPQPSFVAEEYYF